MNGEKVIELTCAEVVPLIAHSGPQLDLVISRRPADDCQSTGADVATAAKQFHPVTDQAVVVARSVDRKNMKEDVI